MHPVYLLLFFTLAVVVFIGIWQFRSVRGSQRKRNETQEKGHPFGPSS